jgi:hypothetical protein
LLEYFRHKKGIYAKDSEKEKEIIGVEREINKKKRETKGKRGEEKEREGERNIKK